MLAALVVMLRSLALICWGHRAVALENLALRHSWRCSDALAIEIDCWCCSPGLATGARR